MAFKKVDISSDDPWRGRSMSNGRLLATAMTWVFAIAAIYCSLFYIPALYDFDRGFDLSSRVPNAEKSRSNPLSPAIQLLRQNRAYMRAGQSMEAVYDILGPTKGDLVIYACNAPTIIEVFRCEPVVIQKIPIQKQNGQHAVRIQQNGFYGYRLELADASADYDLVWRRRFN